MKAILLDGTPAHDLTGGRVRSALEDALLARGWQVEHVLLREQKIGNCAGDFFCWVRSPGVCNVDDDNRDVAAAIVGSDLMVYLTPVTFGGYSSALKRMVDHQIQNISPFFATVAGETHHEKRYARYPDFLVVGWQDAPDAQAEATFRQLVRRNTINFYAGRALCDVVSAGEDESELAARAGRWLEAIERGENTLETAWAAARARRGRHLALPPTDAALVGAGAIRRAVLLVGSPRTRKSTSYALGSYLMGQLTQYGVETQTIQVYTGANSPERLRLLREAVEAADLAVLAFPLYVDSLPAPVIRLLEELAAGRAGRATGPRFAAIANSGFPEAHHNETALAICAQFAREAGFLWAGSLALGAGEMVHGSPLEELGGRTVRIRKGLAVAAAALAAGRPIPEAAVGLLARPVVPPWIYRFMGGVGWKRQAKAYGAQKLLRRRAYEQSRAPGVIPSSAPNR